MVSEHGHAQIIIALRQILQRKMVTSLMSLYKKSSLIFVDKGIGFPYVTLAAFKKYWVLIPMDEEYFNRQNTMFINYNSFKLFEAFTRSVYSLYLRGVLV